jgi:hypothetical protein
VLPWLTCSGSKVQIPAVSAAPRVIALRYKRCAHTFVSGICLAAVALIWTNES